MYFRELFEFNEKNALFLNLNVKFLLSSFKNYENIFNKIDT